MTLTMIGPSTPLWRQLLSHGRSRISSAVTHYKTALAVLLLLVSANCPAAIANQVSTNTAAAPSSTINSTTSSKTSSTSPTTTAGRTTITFSCAITAGSPAYAMTEAFYQKVFDRLNYDFTMIALPVAREAIEMSAGNYDGSCGRTSNPAFSRLPSLIKIETPIAKFSLELIATKALPHIKTLDDLPPGSSIAYVRGGATLEAKLKQYPKLNSFPASNEASALKMLMANRVDFYLRGKTPTNKVLFEPDIDIPLHAIINWDLYYLYPYLHARHSELTTALEAEIQRELKTYPDQYLGLPSAK